MSMIENLESRQMFSVSAYLDGSTLYVHGDANKNEIYIERTEKNDVDHLRVKEKGNTVKVKLLDYGGVEVSTVTVAAINDVVVYGKGSDDKLEAKSSGDSAVKNRVFWYGGDGNDRIRPGKGKDIVEGGAGSDTIDYSKYSADVEVHLESNLPEASGRQGSDTDRDTLKTIEHAKGGKGDDILVGNSLANKLCGGDGNDTITGGLGADEMDGDDGDDLFYVWEAIDVKDEIDGGDDHDIVVDMMIKDNADDIEQFVTAI